MRKSKYPCWMNYSEVAKKDFTDNLDKYETMKKELIEYVNRICESYKVIEDKINGYEANEDKSNAEEINESVSEHFNEYLHFIIRSKGTLKITEDDYYMSLIKDCIDLEDVKNLQENIKRLFESMRKQSRIMEFFKKWNALEDEKNLQENVKCGLFARMRKQIAPKSLNIRILFESTEKYYDYCESPGLLELIDNLDHIYKISEEAQEYVDDLICNRNNNN